MNKMKCTDMCLLDPRDNPPDLDDDKSDINMYSSDDAVNINNRWNYKNVTIIIRLLYF